MVNPSLAQFEFDFDFAHNGALLRVEEAAEHLQYTDQHIRNLIADGVLLAFPINVYPLPETPRAQAARLGLDGRSPQRLKYRIIRETVKAPLDPSDPQKWEAIVRARFIATIDEWLFPHSRQALTPRNVGDALAIGGTLVRELYDVGHIKAADLAGSAAAKNLSLRFQRASVVAFVRTRLLQACNLK